MLFLTVTVITVSYSIYFILWIEYQLFLFSFNFNKIINNKYFKYHFLFILDLNIFSIPDKF